MTKRENTPLRNLPATEDDATREGTTAGIHSTPVAGSWSFTSRLIASALVVFQITAIFWPPFTSASSVGNGSSSPFADGVMSWLRPYVSLMDLDHGYSFFAPRVAGGHLVHYKVEFADGRAPVQAVFPNKQEQWPRLLYHRYFMLAEALDAAYVPPEFPPAPRLPAGSPALLRREFAAEQQRQQAAEMVIWKHRREQYEALHKSFENHLLAKYGGSKVTITRREHLLLTPDEYLNLGSRLDLPETYIDLPESNLSEVIRTHE